MGENPAKILGDRENFKLNIKTNWRKQKKNLHCLGNHTEFLFIKISLSAKLEPQITMIIMMYSHP